MPINKVLMTTVQVTTGIASAFLLWVMNPLTMKVNDENLELSFKREYSIEDKYFRLKLNEDILLKTSDFVIEDFYKEDISAPNVAENYSYDYTAGGVLLKWQPVLDNGSNNIYEVELINDKGRIIKKSNEISLEYTSGVKGYKVMVNDKIYDEVLDPQFLLKNEDLVEGVNLVKIQSVDNSLNISESQCEVIYYKPYLEINEEKITVLNKDSSQEYNYNLIINEESSLDKLNSDIKITDIFKDLDSVEAPIVGHNLSGNKLTFNWGSEDIGTIYNYRVEGIGQSRGNKVFSDNYEYTATSGIKGYYYEWGETPSYEVTEEDTFTTDTSFTIDGIGYSTYYIHVIAVDNAGNKSSQVTYSVTNTKPAPSASVVAAVQPLVRDSKMDLIESMVVRGGWIDEGLYNTHLMAIYNYIPTSTLETIRSNGTTIYYTSGNLRQYLIGDLGYDPGQEIWGMYRAKNTSVYVTTSASIRTSIHELGHAFDHCNPGYTKSYLNGFYNIYLEEKDSLFGAGNYFASDEEEYFAESFYLYLMDPGTLSAKAPQTYNYFVDSL